MRHTTGTDGVGSHGSDSNEDKEETVQGEPVLPAREDAHALTIVGIGASAGGVRALQEFFEHAPADGGSAYVVVLHLSPEHESHLAEVIGRATTMPVRQVVDTVTVEPNQVYVIPPARDMELYEGKLYLRQSQHHPKGRRVVVDHFFRTLAEAQGPQVAAVVLSGSGMDGTLGLKLVKELGGLTIAQEPGEAEHDAMPRSAITSGMVDYVLPARDIASQIASYWETSRRMRIPEEAAPSPEQRDASADAEVALREILSHLRARTGHDFAHYKRATVLRRIARRLQVNGQESLPAYLDYLRRNPVEANALLADLMISVTQFFRDREAWEALERDVIPLLFENKVPEDSVRAWVCGCATGEEAYSLAILLMEYAAQMESPPRLQIFATDMDNDSIAHAREGCYPETIAQDVTPERLRRWFSREDGQLRVRKEVREVVLFASHNVLSDTPFSRLDLVTCRNLLIYLTAEAQERVFELFHFALRSPDGRLFLGSAESAEGGTVPLFSPTNRQHRLYVRRSIARQAPAISTIAARAAGNPRAAAAAPARFPPVVTAETGVSLPPPPVEGNDELDRRRSVSPAQLHRTLLELLAPPSVLITQEHEVVHMSPGAVQYLRLPAGEPTTNLLLLTPPELRLELRDALNAAIQEGRDQFRRVRWANLGANRPQELLRLAVRPVRLREEDRGYFMVIFEVLSGNSTDSTPDALSNAGSGPTSTEASASEPPSEGTSALIYRLEEEISDLERLLRHSTAQYDASVEELKASNEELQSMNEEIRSTAEELETSKEELQSVNEELTTVNLELKVRVEEVSRANADLQNLLAATDIGTIFLDRALRIQRYTPPAQALFNFIPTDMGRPLSDLTHRLDYPTLIEDAEQVLERLTVVEREVQHTTDGRWFLTRLLPYRTLEDRISGVVATFVDITRRKQAEESVRASLEALRQSEERFRLLVEGARDYAMFLLDIENHITFWSRGAERVFGWSEAEVLGKSGEMIFTPEDRERGEHHKEWQTAVAEGSAEDRRWHVKKDGSLFWADGLLMRLDGETGGETVRGFAKITRDATDQKRAEDAQRASEQALAKANEALEARVAERTENLTVALDALESHLNERQHLLGKIVSAQEQERRRLSRELHDQTGQHLAALILGCKAFQDALTETHALPPDSPLWALLTQLRGMLQTLGRDLHHVAVELRPTALDDLGIASALATYVSEWSTFHKIPADVDSIGMEGGEGKQQERLTPEVETALYRISQEALTNIFKHAVGVKKVSVVLERRPDQVQLIVEDDGAGFDPEAKRSQPGQHLGLVNMRERAELVGGTIEIESEPGHGATLYVRIPLAAAS